jgi:hypothetical protein
MVWEAAVGCAAAAERVEGISETLGRTEMELQTWIDELETKTIPSVRQAIDNPEDAECVADAQEYVGLWDRVLPQGTGRALAQLRVNSIRFANLSRSLSLRPISESLRQGFENGGVPDIDALAAELQGFEMVQRSQPGAELGAFEGGVEEASEALFVARAEEFAARHTGFVATDALCTLSDLATFREQLPSTRGQACIGELSEALPPLLYREVRAVQVAATAVAKEKCFDEALELLTVLRVQLGEVKLNVIRARKAFETIRMEEIDLEDLRGQLEPRHRAFHQVLVGLESVEVGDAPPPEEEERRRTVGAMVSTAPSGEQNEARSCGISGEAHL